MFADLRFRLRSLFNRGAMERELDDELRFHLEREAEKHLRQGMSRDEAMRHARLAFGGVDRIKDDARDARGINMVESLLQDLRYAWRGLRAKPGFASAVVLTLGLGIGANTAMFGIVDRLLFRPPAYLHDADRVHRVYLSWLTLRGERRTDASLEYRRYLDFKEWTTSFDMTAAFTNRRLAVGIGEDVRELNIGVVSASLFDFFDAPPALGRYFQADEDRTPVGAPVVVLGHGYWQSRYGGRHDVLGSKIQIENAVYTVIGVAPEGFVGITEEAAPAAFIPVTAFAGARNSWYYENYNWGWLLMVARRKPGVSQEAATADLTSAYERSWEKQRQRERFDPATQARPQALAASIHVARGPTASRDSRVVAWVMGVAVIVLLVACANVANLLLARAVQRQREIVLRMALGVSRRRLLQQLFTESVLLAALGGAAGLAIAQWGGRALRALFLRAEDAAAVSGDARTMVFTAIATLAVALLTGMAPVVHGLRGDATRSLKTGAREGTYRRSRARMALLVFQGALSVVLLIGAGLFVRSLSNVRALRLGYDADSVVYVEANTRGATLTPAQENELADRLLAGMAGVPGIRSATLTISVPFYSSEGRGIPFVPGADTARMRRLGRFTLQAGSPSYFQTVGTRILRGRGFTADDRAGSAPVVVISEQMAKAVWPEQDALGKVIRVGSDTMPFMTVVGIAENVRTRQITGEPEMWYYLPVEHYRARYGTSYPTLYARVDGRAEDYVETARRRLQREMPGASYVNTRTLESLVAPQQRSWVFGARMFVAFGALALLLAAIGLYSVIAYAVAQRTHELGVRIALGASVGDVVRMIVGQGVSFAVAGIAIGSVIALWAGKWVEPMLFSQKARDPVVFAIVGAVLLVVAIVATLRPALRATRVDPTVALRAE